MQLAARTGAWIGKPLPYLRRVAYLESHGTEWIDTRVKYHSSMSIRMKYERLSMGDAGSVVAATNTTNPVLYFAALNNDNLIDRFVLRRSGYSEANYSFRFSYPYLAEVYLDAAEDKLYLNGSSVKSGMIAVMGGYVNPYYSRSNIYLFGIENSYRSKSRIYVFGAKGGANVPAVSLIPVLDLSGRPAMYDEVSGQLFYNQGTGEFTWGELET